MKVSYTSSLAQATQKTVTANTRLIFVPLMVRFANPTATYRPWRTTETRRPTSYSAWEEPSEAISPRLRKLILGLCIPLGVLFFSVVSYIIWYVRHRRKRSKASQIEQAESSGSVVTGEAAQTENKVMREPTPRQVFLAERSGSLPPGSTAAFVAPETDEERRLRYREESLKERREQLAMEEEALRRQRVGRMSVA